MTGCRPYAVQVGNRQLEYTQVGDLERLAMRVLHDDTGARVPLTVPRYGPIPGRHAQSFLSGSASKQALSSNSHREKGGALWESSVRREPEKMIFAAGSPRTPAEFERR
jgi:hypothetical protein